MYLDSSLSGNKTPIRPKFSVPVDHARCRVYAGPQEKPFSRLKGDDLLDTGDLCRLYNASPRTVYRWMAEHGLTHSVKIGREYLFRKDAILYWDQNYRPIMGRPMRR